jgi:hypothetical protein
MTSFETAVAILGALLVGGALISGIARRSFPSLTAVFVLVGFALGDGGLEVLRFDATGGFVSGLATVALVVILFRDGLEVDSELLRREWHLPLRKLVLAMPITAAIMALAARAVTTCRGRRPSCSARCCRPPTRCCRPAWSPIRACRASSATRSTSSRGSTTVWRCRPCWLSPRWRWAMATSCGGSSSCRTSRWAWPTAW